MKEGIRAYVRKRQMRSALVLRLHRQEYVEEQADELAISERARDVQVGHTSEVVAEAERVEALVGPRMHREHDWDSGRELGDEGGELCEPHIGVDVRGFLCGSTRVGSATDVRPRGGQPIR